MDYKDKEYRFGTLCFNKELTKNWSPSQYLINNQQLYRSSSQIYYLVPLSNKLHFAIKKILYAMFDLDNTTTDRYFTFMQIYENIKANEEKYNYFIQRRVTRSSEISVTKRYSNMPQQLINENKLNELILKRKIYNKRVMDVTSKLSKMEMLTAMALMWDIFINIKTKISDKEFDNGVIKECSRNRYYGMNSEAKKLKKMFEQQNYLL